MHATLEHMTLWSLISDASLLVKAVMLTLLLASLLSWYLIVQRSLALRHYERTLDRFQARFRSEADLAPLYAEQDQDDGVGQVFRAGYAEYVQLKQRPGAEPEAILSGVERSLQVAISEQELQLEKGLQFLATVGSVSPYIGLFGTVWGIMNAFGAIASAGNTNLTTVAPAISEALFATAVGLFAAIPAYIAYNKFSIDAGKFTGRLESFADDLQAAVARRLGGAASEPRREA